MPIIKIALLDDHALLLAGLKMLISAQEDMRVVAEAQTAQEALKVIPATTPDCILLDISLPDMSGMELLPLLKERLPSSHIILLTMHEDQQYLKKGMELGASGFLLKRAMDQDLLYAIRTVYGGGIYIQPDMLKYMVGNKSASVNPQEKAMVLWNTLSPREQDVMIQLAKGFSSREIADACNLSEKTVATYRYRGFLKLGISRRSELVAFVMKIGVLS
jgi:two-component system response regulator NreC